MFQQQFQQQFLPDDDESDDDFDAPPPIPAGIVQGHVPGRFPGLPPSAQAPASVLTETDRKGGTFSADNGKFGFIRPDEAGPEMFVMPNGCHGFGGRFPQIGTRVTFEVVTDGKTGRPRAENVTPETCMTWEDFVAMNGGVPMQGGPEVGAGAPMHANLGPDFGASIASSQMARHGGGDIGTGVPDMEAMLRRMREGQAPEAQPQHQFMPEMSQMPQNSNAGDTGSKVAGTVVTNTGKFAFIDQDAGGDNMFLMPQACHGFGGVLPEVGVRVLYDVVLDNKTGRPRAENVFPEPAGQAPQASKAAGSMRSGTIVRSDGKFGFIKDDQGGDDMFVMPQGCPGYNGQLPPMGTRVCYEVVNDSKTGRPRAENVHPEGKDIEREEGSHYGTMLKDNGKFGFINPDAGGDHMFVIASGCEAFGRALPPEGVRVAYEVIIDSKTGKPRADNVRPEGMTKWAATGQSTTGSSSSAYGKDPDAMMDQMKTMMGMMSSMMDWMGKGPGKGKKGMPY
eukprot:gnl/TRDRNA2_/TRDRNA2_155733_c0_seq1.p1 gnl/TRDRNA2_/TRDRNA2_155733_c0~~gnl/TRDRNA2_/TRDRNA2_155733_c0_seq1.p1  ORF type:complete len:508 (-),score=82.74 gnl/TRDRNA2_/TRDRNA2_155733_c0_seq1:58-1581(-)